MGARSRAARTVRLGAGVTYTGLAAAPLAGLLPALAEAARTVGSPQIRNAGTIGGNLGTARRPATRCRCCRPSTPPSRCSAADGGRDACRSASSSSARSAPRSAPGELITAVTVPRARRPAGVPQGRRPQRDGHRRAPAPVVDVGRADRGRCGLALGRSAPTVCGRPRPSAARPPGGRLGRRRRSATPTPRALRRAGGRGEPARSTTTAAPRPTAATPSASCARRLLRRAVADD